MQTPDGWERQKKLTAQRVKEIKNTEKVAYKCTQTD